MPSIPEIWKEPVEDSRKGADVLSRSFIELAGLNDVFLYVLFVTHLVKYLIGAVKQWTVHILFFQIFVYIPDGIGPFRRTVYLLQHLYIRFYGIPAV